MLRRVIPVVALLAGLVLATGVSVANEPAACQSVETSLGVAERCRSVDELSPASFESGGASIDLTAGPELPSRIPCTPADGGPVVRVVYAYQGTNKLDGGSRPVRPSIERIVAAADWIVADAARAGGAVRHVRWHTPGCKLGVKPLHYVPGRLEEALEQAGLYDEGERGDKIMVFLDNPGSNGDWGCLGEALSYDDDSPSQSNLNNQLEEYAWVSCSFSNFDGWALAPWVPAEIFTHELTHLLGAVQDSAPHALGGGHTKETADLMREVLGEGTGKACAASIPEPLDCHGDDYFNVAPRAGTYLDNHWNVADSRYLSTLKPSRWIPVATPRVRVKVPAEVVRTAEAAVTVAVPPGLRVDSKVEVLVDGKVAGSDDTRPYRVQFYPGSSSTPAVSGQRLAITARVMDIYGWSTGSAAARAVFAVPGAVIRSPAPYRAGYLGDTLRVQADASAVGSARVRKVEFVFAGDVVATDARPPYAATIQLPGVISNTDPTANLVARVTDTKGRSEESPVVPVVVLRLDAYAGLQPGDTFAANRPATIPVGIWGTPAGPLQWVDVRGLTVDVVVDQKRLARLPAGSLVARGQARVGMATVAMPPPGEHTLEIQVRRGQKVLQSWSTTIETVATNASVRFVTPKPGAAGTSVRAKLRFTGGVPSERKTSFVVNDAYPVDGDKDFAARLRIGSGLHVITAHYRPDYDSPDITGPSVLVTAREFTVKAKITRRDRRFDDDWLYLRASLNGMRPSWLRARGSITWYVNDLRCFEPREFDAIPKPLTGSCRLPAGVDWKGAEVRAVVELKQQDYTPIGWAVSPPVRIP